jgi:hypothetical protein
MNYVLTVKELEAKYKVKKGKAKRYPVDKENIPEQFWVLIPYIDYFCLDAQEEREDFCELLPQTAFQHLADVLNTFEPALTEWLADNAFKKKPNTEEYYALCTLGEVVDNFCKYPDPPKPDPLTDAQKERAAYLLKLSQTELKLIWNLQSDTYERYIFDPTQLPENLKQIASVLSIIAISNDDWHELDIFKNQLPALAQQDIKIVRQLHLSEITAFCYSTPFGNLSPELLAVDVLRRIFQ